MKRVFQGYCDRCRGGVQWLNLRFMQHGDRIDPRETFLPPTNLDETYAIDCYIPLPLPDAEFLAKVGALHYDSAKKQKQLVNN